MWKKLNNEEGSGLVFLLIVVTLVILLGSTLIAMSISNYKMANKGEGGNKSFYINDGAIEEALAELDEITHRAEVAATDVINETDWVAQPDHFRNEPKWIEFESVLLSKLTSGEITDDEAALEFEKGLEREFEKVYFQELLHKPSVETDYILLDENKAFVDEGGLVLDAKSTQSLKSNYVKAIEKVDFTPSDFQDFEGVAKPTLTVESNYINGQDYHHGDGLHIKLTSNGSYNVHNKAVEVDLTVIPPERRYAITNRYEDQTVFENVLLDYAVNAVGDMIVVGGNVSVNGDVYAYGSFPKGNRYGEEDLGGIVVGHVPSQTDFLDQEELLDGRGQADLDDSVITGAGNLSVDGDLITRSAIKLGHSDSTLDVTGDGYCNNYFVENGTTETESTFGRNLYMMEDIFISGNDSVLNIGRDGGDDGELWMFLDGIEPGGMTRTNTDISSSVRINKFVTGASINLNNLFISGLAYIDIFREDAGAKVYYQTGESFTTDKNSYLYQELIPSVEMATTLVTYQDEANNTYRVVEPLNAKGEIVESSKYKVDHFLTYIVNNMGENPDIVAAADKSIMNIRSIGKEDREAGVTDNYALGVFQGNGRIYNPNYSMETGTFLLSKMPVLEQVDLAMNTFFVRDYVAGDNANGKFNELAELTTDVIQTANLNDVLIVTQSGNDSSVYINPPDGFLPPNGSIVLDGVSEMNGLVITHGDVFVFSEGETPVTINGTIVTEGHVVFAGDGSKTVNYDKNLVYQLAAGNSMVADMLHLDEGRSLEIADMPGQAAETPSKSIWGNLVIDTVHSGEQMDVLMVDSPELTGTSKDRETVSYIINNWVEI